MKTRLGEAGIGDDTIEEIARRFDERGAAFGEDGDVTGEVARRYFAELTNNIYQNYLILGGKQMIENSYSYYLLQQCASAHVARPLEETKA